MPRGWPLARLIEALPNEGADALVALFEIGAYTTSMQVMHDDDVLYDRDQAFGGAQLTQLIVRQYGFSLEEAEAKKRSGELPEDYESAVLHAVRRQHWRRRSAARCSSSSPARRTTGCDYIMLAGGSAALPGPEGRASPTAAGFACDAGQSVRGHEARPAACARTRLRREAPSYLTVVRPRDAEVPAVILINLLPHREAARKRRATAFFAGLGLSAVAGAADRRRRLPVVAAQISTSRSRNAFLQHRDQPSSMRRSRTSPT